MHKSCAQLYANAQETVNIFNSLLFECVFDYTIFNIILNTLKYVVYRRTYFHWHFSNLMTSKHRFRPHDHAFVNFTCKVSYIRKVRGGHL